MARLGAPARRFRRAYVKEGMNHEIHEIHERWNNRTTNGHEWDTNNFFIGKKVVRGWRAWARPRVASAARPVYDSLSAPNRTASAVLKGRPLQSVHALPSSLSSLLSTSCIVSTHSPLPSPPYSLLWTPTAKCPRTLPYLLLPTLYFFIHVVRISIPCLDSEWWERPFCRVPAV